MNMRVDGPKIPQPEEPQKPQAKISVSPIRSGGQKPEKMSDKEIKQHLASVKEQSTRKEPASVQETLKYLEESNNEWIEEFCVQLESKDPEIGRLCFAFLASDLATSEELLQLAQKKDYSGLQNKIPGGRLLSDKLQGKVR